MGFLLWMIPASNSTDQKPFFVNRLFYLVQTKILKLGLNSMGKVKLISRLLP